MSKMASQIISLTIVYSTIYSRRKSKETSKLHVTGLCEGNSPVTGEFPAQRASNAEIVSIYDVIMTTNNDDDIICGFTTRGTLTSELLSAACAVHSTAVFVICTLCIFIYDGSLLSENICMDTWIKNKRMPYNNSKLKILHDNKHPPCTLIYDDILFYSESTYKHISKINIYRATTTNSKYCITTSIHPDFDRLATSTSVAIIPSEPRLLSQGRNI